MFGRVAHLVNAIQKHTVQKRALRNVNVLDLSKRNATVTAIQKVSDDLSNARPYEDIPGPKPLPILGNAWRIFPGFGGLAVHTDVNVHKSLYEQFGKIMKISKIPGRGDIVVIFDPDDIEKVFRNEGPWPIRVGTVGFKPYRAGTRKDIFQGVEGLMATQGEKWLNFRRKVNPIMMQPRSAKPYVEPINTVANDLVERIRLLRDDEQEMSGDFNNDLNKWALESVVFIALDTRLGFLEKELKQDSEAKKLIDALEIQIYCMGKMANGLPIWKYVSTPNWRAFVKSSDYFVQIAMKYIHEAMNRLSTLPEDPDRELTVLEKILARDPDPKTAIVMALDMMTAAVDTTAYSVAVALYHIAKNPDKQQILFEEIKKFVPDKEQPITTEILNELKYLKACIKESMRMSPVIATNNRKLIKDLQLAGYHVPKGTNIVMPFRFISNEERYFQQADRFIPERWLKDGPYSNIKIHSFVTLPFGFGPRMCVGKRFADLEIGVLLTKVVRNFRLAYNYGDIKSKPKILYTIESPLKFKMEDRED